MRPEDPNAELRALAELEAQELELAPDDCGVDAPDEFPELENGGAP